MKKLLDEIASPRYGGTRNDTENLIKDNLPKLKRYIFSKVSDSYEAEEILQETLVAANESYLFFKGKSSFFTWVCAIANHEIADFYRRKKIKTILFSRFPFLEQIVSQALIPDDEFEKQELRHEVKKILSLLTEGYGEILRLKYYQSLSMLEIAQKLKITVKAVESRLSRARGAFKTLWEMSFQRDGLLPLSLRGIPTLRRETKQSLRSPRGKAPRDDKE